MLTSGGPGGKTRLPMLFAYEEAFHYGQFGYAAAMGVVMVAVIAVLLTVFLRNRLKEDRPVSATTAPPAGRRPRGAPPDGCGPDGSRAAPGSTWRLLCYLVFLAFPLVWLVSTAFKSPRELGSDRPDLAPAAPHAGQLPRRLRRQPLLRSALNSLIVAGGAALISVAVAVPAAYVMVRYRSAVSRAATGWILVSQMFPFVLVIIPLFLVLKNLHLINSLAGLVIVYVVWNLPFALWMLQGYVKAVPVSLEEAAAVDGCEPASASCAAWCCRCWRPDWWRR